MSSGQTSEYVSVAWKRSNQQYDLRPGAIRERGPIRVTTPPSISIVGSSIIDFLKSQQAAAYPNGSLRLGTERLDQDRLTIAV
jgi:hypothetical protein